MNLDDVAEELYTLPPSEFTAARDARVAEARKAGDRVLAKDIAALKRPTAAAWAVNLLANQRSEVLGELVGLGASLHRAQEELAGDELRRLSRQRLGVVSALVEEAESLAEEAGQPVSQAVLGEVHETLEAVLADEQAARAVLSGRLTKGLEYSGMGTVGGSTTRGRVAAGRKQARRPTTKATNGDERQKVEAEAKEARKAAEERRRARVKAESQVGRLQGKLAEAKEELLRLRAEEKAAQSRLGEAQREERGATQAEERAMAALRRARER